MKDVTTELKALGLIVDSPILDGAIHRCSTESNPKGKNGWYRGGSKFVNGKDIFWCVAGDWSQGDGALVNYKSWKDDNDFSAADREAIRKQQAESAEKAKAETARLHEEAEKKANQKWVGLSETGTSQYLIDKDAEAYGIRFGSDKNGNYIAILLCDFDSKIKNL